MKKTLMFVLSTILAIIYVVYNYPNNIHFVKPNETNTLSHNPYIYNTEPEYLGSELTYSLKYNFDSIKVLFDIVDEHGEITNLNVDKVMENYNDKLIEHISNIKEIVHQSTSLNIDESQLKSSIPSITIRTDRSITSFFDLEREHKNLLNHFLIDSLVVTPLSSRPPIEIEDPGGGGTPSNQYDMYHIKNTVNDSLLQTGSNVKVGILETYEGVDYLMVDPSINYFKSGNVIHDPNIPFNSYHPHATTVGILSSGHHGIAKDSKVYSTSFKHFHPTQYTINQALNWLSQTSSNELENINVDIVNMSFINATPINEVRDFTYLNRKIMIAGAGNEVFNSVGYPGAFPNVFSVGATTPGGDSLWINPLDSFIGSSYINNSNGIDKPNIVAPGMVSFPNLPYDADFVQGTSLSSPIVAGAVAKLIEAKPSLKMFPELVFALLMATSNQDILSSITQQYLNNIGEKTGSGMLDISKLVNNRNNTQIVNSNDLSNNKYTYSLFIDNPTHTEKKINIAAYWFEKIENNTQKLSNYDISVNANGVTYSSKSIHNNFELIKFTTNYHGYITVTLELKSFAGSNEDLIGIAWSLY